MTDPNFLTYDPQTLAPEAAALLPGLSDADAVVRRIALIELADLEDPDALQPIVAALKHDDSADVRSEAARVLGAWEEPAIVEALCHALIDADREVREAAASSLSALKDVASGAVLCAWIDRPEPFVKAAVLRALRELRVADAFAPALRALAPLADIAARDPDAEIRRAAIGALGFAQADDSVMPVALLQALHDPVWQVREEAATTLGKLRAQSARDALIAALDDDYWQVRLRAARALGQLGDRVAARQLVSLLSHTISNLRKEAALALGELRDPSTAAALREASGDADPDVRKAARIALQQLGQVTR
ncbi:HEAT repeat domain-containing protein [Paraburkholderia sp. CNPSo 3157]|uniref:HEAT repeat domain-containing protein n=1 Tax=Paraburkholderia franconis TaxID=2654983 RepID=A0A7X1TG49_9BURK|nr:HEAT repeat domain-containing protein [Paraburkholderia franconis]MPW18013.1 HEAT repeat domain-containing protein [Paraburkholderia franconis]